MLRRLIGSPFPGFLLVLGGIFQLSAQSTTPAGGIIHTVAGTDWTFTIPGGQGLNAPLGQVYGLAADSSGNVYAVDKQNSVVVKIAPGGTVATVAGNGIAGFSGDGGAAVNASLNLPDSVALDPGGNLYIADSANNRIRRVSAVDGTITTIAGTGAPGYAGDQGPALSALLNFPNAIAVDASGNIAFYDANNLRIRRIASGIISTIAGNGSSGYTKEGPATTVPTDVVSQLAYDSAGNLYFGDNEYHVRRVTTAGQTVLVAGNGNPEPSTCSAPPCNGDNGLAANATLFQPLGLAIDNAGNIFIADFNRGRIREVLSNGTIITYAGSGNIQDSGDNGPALNAGMNPIALAVTGSGLVYLADYSTYVIRKIDAAKTITTVAGNGKYRSVPDGTPAINSFFDRPEGVATDSSGNLYIADYNSNRIRQVTSSGAFSTIAGTGTPGCCDDGTPASAALLYQPTSVALDSKNNIYFADSANHRIREITLNGSGAAIKTVAGVGRFDDPAGGAFGGDNGPATSAHLNAPMGLAFDSRGPADILYIADTGNNVIRRVDASGVITTFAGTPQKSGFGGDGSTATSALLNLPFGVAVDPTSGSVYIADTYNHSVRVVTNGVISTYAGNQKQGSSGDNGPAKNASLNFPVGLTLDPSGNLYILEVGSRIRQVTPAGIITTIAGTGLAGFSGDGGPSTSAQISLPFGSMAWRNGTLYFTDTANQRVRAITFAGAPGTTLPSIVPSPTSLSFTAVSGGAATSKTTVTVSSSSPGFPVQIATPTTSGGQWLLADAATATCPATIGISANPAGLAAGTYQGAVTISSPYASPSQVTIPVTFTVTGAATGHLTADPVPISVDLLNGATPVTAHIALANSGSGSLSFTATATTAGAAWLSVTPSSGTVSASAPTALTVTITPGSLPASVYSGVITLSSPDNSDPPIVIPVTCLVGNPVPIILVSQTGLTYQSVQGGGNPLSQDISILNIGQGSMNWTATAQTLSGNNWLSVSPASGTVTTPFVSFSTTTISVDASSLAPGNYFGQIQVRANGASNTPQTVSVVLNVFGPGTALSPEVRPSGLVFIGSSDNPPGSQTVSIANRGMASFSYNSFKGTLSNINWITNTPATGTVPVNFPTRMTVQPDLSQRSAGVDRGAITILFNDGSSQTVSLLSVVPPAGYTPSAVPEQIRAAAFKPHASGGCSASMLLAQLINPASTVSQTPLGQPVSLNMSMTDDCGNPVTSKYPASVNVSFSTGEPGLSMQSIGNGGWTQTWQPRSPQPTTVTVQVNAFATSNGKLLAAQFSMTVTLTSAAQVPLVSPGGIVNAASYSSAPVVSPGGLIAIFGNQLADPTGQQPPPGPVPTSLGHTQVKLGDALLPLFYTSNVQLNAQVPFSLPVNSQQQLVVQYGNTLSVPASVSVSAAQPAIYTQNQQGTGQGAIENAVTGLVADSGHPVHAGDIIAIFCTGLGPVNPAVAEGVAASTTVLSQTVTPVTATVGGQAGTVNFAGLAPGFVGLYQVNVVIPNGVTPGDNVPVVLTEGSQSSQPVTISVR